MALDMNAVLTEMIGAVRGVVAGDWPKVRECVRKALAEERDFLAELAQARLSGEIGDDTLAAQLRDEKETLEAVLLVCQLLGKKMIQDAANAAIDVFNRAIKAALGVTVGVARRRKGGSLALSDRRLNARPDTVDFRDLMYVPTLVEVGTRIPLERYRKSSVPILDQGAEGACTGFGLATVAHYLLRMRQVVPDRAEISPRMLYAMARRYDEWPGEAYEGSSCRGAVKGWHKHGVCSGNLWKHDPRNPDYALDTKRADDARNRPLGAYFRVNHKDLVAMHAAISEVGVLYASASVHSGWEGVKRDGIIRFDDTVRPLGGHAFAIVAYDESGLWIQNSWGERWGMDGFARMSYADWLRNGSDVWVVRLGVPMDAPQRAGAGAALGASARASAYAYDDVRPHVVSIGNDGELRGNGNIGTTPEQVRRILRQDFPEKTQGWAKRRLVLYAHGGLVSENSAVQRISEYRAPMLDAQCYPLAFIWHSDYWSTIKAMLEDAARQRRPEGFLSDVKDFMLDRLDDALEPIARKLTGKAAWDEMKENASLATESDAGGARLVLDEIATLAASDPKVEIHVVGHSAGSIFHAPLVRRLTAPAAAGGLGLKIASCTLWAPACTMALFEQAYVPAIRSGAISRFALYTLTDQAEQDDDCARIYNKSLLYLVSHAFEKRARIPILRPEGEPILGMARFVRHEEMDFAVERLIDDGRIDWIQAPNAKPVGDPGASAARAHGAFDDDKATVASTLLRIAGATAAAKGAARALKFRPGTSRLRSFRTAFDLATR